MAMSFNENLDDNGEMHEINVTPFIDVMLVLLIIFMVAAPLATVDVKVNLPASTSTPQPRPEKPVYLSVKADKSMFIGNNQVTDDTMISELNTLTDGKKDTTIFFRADKTFNRRGINDTPVIHGFRKLSRRNSNILHRTEHIGKLKTDKFHILFLHNIQNLLPAVSFHITISFS